MKHLWRKCGILLCGAIYLTVSQFVFKAYATTSTPEEVSSDSVCYGKKLDTFDSKQSCRKGSFTTQAGSEGFEFMYDDGVVHHYRNTSVLFQFESLGVEYICPPVIHPPPDLVSSRVVIATYIGSVKRTI